MIDSQEKVTKIEDLLASTAVTKKNQNESNAQNSSVSKNSEKNKINKKGTEKSKNVIPKGKPKSGRVWKEQKQRFSSIVKTKGIRTSFEKKQKLREDLKRVKELSREVKAQKEADKVAKKERRKENLRRQEENSKKNEVVQVIKNTAKIKRMKKKQLRTLQKRDTVKT